MPTICRLSGARARASWPNNDHPQLPTVLRVRPVGTAGFEFNGPHAGPLFYRHLRAPKDRIGTHRKLWNGKHYGKHFLRRWMTRVTRAIHPTTFDLPSPTVAT